MLIQNTFTVTRPVDEVWAYLLEVERIAPCMPGAELTETVDDRHWKGKVAVKFGPVSMAFAGTVAMEERDDAAHRVTLHAKGMEQRGKGAANAVITAALAAADDRTQVSIDADITLTGAAAQLSRGLLPEVSKRLTAQFADCLHEHLAAEPESAGSALPSAVHPVGGLRLGIAAAWAGVMRFFRRLSGPRDAPPPAS
jgi:carbon monoxide dehydrogenase subunit G